jgi:serine protease AprX
MSMSLSARRTRAAAVTTVMAALAWAAVTPAVATPQHGQAASGAATVDPALRGVNGAAHVVVRGTRSAAAAVTREGGRVTHELPIIGGFSATVPGGSIDRIARLPGVTSITDDAPMRVSAAPLTDDSGPTAPQPADVYQSVAGADALQAHGDSGQGVTVALIDTGVTAMPDLAGRLVPVSSTPFGPANASCVNFAGDGTCDDEYGHGTFIAGLIAGTGAQSSGEYAGVAPNAKILSIKIAGADGSADVSTVIAALQWVVLFHRSYGIKVLNLSLGSNSDQPYSLSPLDFAVEQAWKAGVTVVVSASNLGPAAGTIDKPADDPYVLTVGAIDDQGTVDTSDDSVPDFSARGPTAADGLDKPDLVAPGAHLVSLAAPGASITTQFPSDMPAPYRRGSGTSMSTAVTSGLVADVLSARPTWTPDRVKFALTATANPDASSDPETVGAGLVDGYAALSAPAGLANQGIRPSRGTGSLQADRGGLDVSLPGVGSAGGYPLTGNVTAALTSWNSLTAWLGVLIGSNGNEWYGTQWAGNEWYGNEWYGSQWYGNEWYGNEWYGNEWYGNEWYGSQWYGVWD